MPNCAFAWPPNWTTMGIEELQGEGEFESTGQFTLDARLAREKMARFALAGPADYLLKLVQAANLLGAVELRLNIEGAGLGAMFFGAASLDVPLLADCLNGVCPLPAEPVYTALFLGLNDALNRHHMKLVWQAPDEGFVLHSAPDGTQKCTPEIPGAVSPCHSMSSG